MTSDLPPTGGSQPPPEPSPTGPSGPVQSGPAAPAGPATASGSTIPPGPSPAAGPSPNTGHASDEFFNRIRSAGVTRPDEGRWIAGVAAGLGRRWDIDPILVRGVFVALSIFGGIGVVFYGLAWLLLPQDDGRIHLQQAIRGDITAGFIGAVLLSLAAIGGGGGGGPWEHGFWFGWAFPGGLILAVAVVFGIWWLAKRTPEDGKPGGSTWTSGWTPGTTTGTTPTPGSGSTSGTAPYSLPPVYGTPSAGPTYGPTSTAPSAWSGTGQSTDAVREARQAAKAQAQAAAAAKSEEMARAAKARRARTGPSKTIVRLSLGIALLIAAAILTIGNANDWSEPVGLIAAASALAVLAVGVIASGLSGRRASGLVGIGLVLAIGVLIGAGVDNAGVRSNQNLTLIGDRTWEPSTPSAAEKQYNLGVGQGTLWLTNPAILNGATTSDPLQVRVRLGAGHLTVIVPDGVTTRFVLEMGGGDVSYPDGSTFRFRDSNNSTDQQFLTGPPGLPRMIIDARQGAGQMDIRTSSGTSVTTIPGPSPSAVRTPGATPTAPAAKPTTPAAKPKATAAPTATITN